MQHPKKIKDSRAYGKNTYIEKLNLTNLSPAKKFQNYIENASDFLPTRVAYLLNLKGECVNIQTACSSSLVSVHMACQSLLTGNSDISLAGATFINLELQDGYYFQKGMIFSKSGFCRPFDFKSDGQVEGDGCGVIVLKRLEDAIKDNDDIYAVIKATAINNDGKEKIGYTAPSVKGQVDVIRAALDFSGINPETIQYVEGHGTATPLGDPIEFKALKQVYSTYTDKENFCVLSSVKGNIGHLSHASGIAGIIKAVLSIKNNLIPGTKHFERINPEIPMEGSPFHITSKNTNWKDGFIKRAAVSSFGIGGTNAHVILEEFKSPNIDVMNDEDNNFYPIIISANSEEALLRSKANLLKYLSKENISIKDLSYTLCKRRKLMAFNWKCMAKSTEELLFKLNNNSDSEADVSLDFVCEGKLIKLPHYPFEKMNFQYDLYEESEYSTTYEDLKEGQSDICTENIEDKMTYIDDSFSNLTSDQNKGINYSNSEIANIVKECCKKHFDDENLNEDLDFFQLGWTSLEVLSLMGDLTDELESKLVLKLPLDEMFENMTINKLIEICIKYAKNKIDPTSVGEYSHDIEIDGEIVQIIIEED